MGLNMLTFNKPIDVSRARELIADPAWCMQQKYDGERVQVRCKAGKVTATSRTGLEYNLGELVEAFRTDVGDYWLDGEFAWGRYYPFEELSVPGRPYVDRLTRCAELVQLFNDDRIRKVRTWRSTERQAAAFAWAEARGVEGVIFRRMDAPAITGADNADAVRFKFKHRAEVVIAGMVIGRNSFRAEMFGASGELVEVARVPLPGLKKPREMRESLEAAGDGGLVAEVEYLYATDAGKLFHPVLIHLRSDKQPTPADCGVDQLEEPFQGEIGSLAVSTIVSREADKSRERAEVESAKAAKQEQRREKRESRKKKQGFEIQWGWAAVGGISLIVIIICRLIKELYSFPFGSGGSRGFGGGNGSSVGGERD